MERSHGTTPRETFQHPGPWLRAPTNQPNKKEVIVESRHGKYMPADRTLVEYFLITKTLTAVKREVCSGVPSGKAIDAAIEEAFHFAVEQ